MNKKIFFAAILFYVFSHNALLAQQDSLKCNGDLIMLLSDELFAVQPDWLSGDLTYTPLQASPPLEEGKHYNAIAYRKTDNSIYGVDYSSPPYTLLFKINAEGYRQIVDTLFFEMGYYRGITAGGITKDQRYLVLIRNMYTKTGISIGTGGFADPSLPNLMYLVDLESADYAFSTIELTATGPNAGVRIGDIAIDPTTGIGYAHDYFTNRIVTIDPMTGALDNSSFPEITIPSEDQTVGGLMFTPFGQLVGHELDMGTEFLVYLNKDNGTLESKIVKDSIINNHHTDGCSCPYTLALEQRVMPDTVFNCQSFEVSCKIAYWLEAAQEGVVFRDSFPDGFIVEEVIRNPYEGDVMGIGTSSFMIRDFTPLNRGIDSIVLRVAVPEGIEPATYFCQASLSGLDLTELNEKRRTVYSDFPLSGTKEDATPITVLTAQDYQNYREYIICPDSSVLLSAAPISLVDQLGFQWEDGSTAPLLEVDMPGSYQVTITDGCGESIINIEVQNGTIDLDLGPDIEIEAGDSLTLDPDVTSDFSITNYYWSTQDTSEMSCLNCFTPVVNPLGDETAYVFIAENTPGCKASEEIIIRLLRNVYGPSAFSPNLDGINDVFYLHSAYPIRIEAFQVFNRWGGLCFDKSQAFTNSSADGWDGKVKGELAESGTYVWHAVLVYEGGYKYELSGEVTLVR